MANGQRIFDFSVWEKGYAGATVTVYKANTTTLASLFLDFACTIGTSNPQVLDSRTINDEEYGKFQSPVYINESYYLVIDDGTQTGITRYPLFTTTGLDLSDSVVQPMGGSQSVALETILGRLVFAEDYGVINSTDSAANTTTIQAAIGAAAAHSSGVVILPSGNIPFTTITLPAGVILVGYGEDATVLISAEAQAVITITGDRAGFRDLTLDGVGLAVGSVGIKMRARQYTRFERFTVKRFETGVDCKGVKFSTWRLFTISNCGTNLKAYGDTTDGGGANASVAGFQYNSWEGGRCELASVCGIDLSFEDSECSFNHFRGILFDSNAKAIRANGARFIDVDDSAFTGNTILFDVLDDTATTGNNKIKGFNVRRSIVNTGAANFRDTCDDVKFTNCDIRGVAFTLTTPSNAITLIDCVEDATVTIAGDGTKLVRQFGNLPGATKGVTTGSAATKAWSLKLQAGEICTGRAMVTGKQRNGIDKATYVFTFTAQKAPSTLAYDAQTGNFTLGNVVTGATSGATGRIIADADGGTTGTLTLHTITGTFVDNEIITDGAGGSALVNGALVAGSVTILDQDIQSSSETAAAWDCAAAGSVDEAEIRVTGEAAKTIDWVVYVLAWRFG